ncbi:DUF2721 domain-containing protein [Bradyrhizobium pachyrhizi]|uniref:DUF2721 domain-containing protein n=1 Tax=Bradyrhizobium pachyrhizi TaxID=280333 RepID=UPI001FD55072|nr:DUF2721 domain-containing protein [Bradyrhizobium pachyrhizi]
MSGRRAQVANARPIDFSRANPKVESMLPDTPSVSQLSHVISQAAAPAFLLGALAAFIAVLISRLNRIIDRSIYLNQISDQDQERCRLKADLPRLARRATMINRAIFWSIMGSISISIVIVVGFVSAFLHIQHERGVAILFIVSVVAFIVSLVDFAREVRIALSELDHYG